MPNYLLQTVHSLLKQQSMVIKALTMHPSSLSTRHRARHGFPTYGATWGTKLSPSCWVTPGGHRKRKETWEHGRKSTSRETKRQHVGNTRELCVWGKSHTLRLHHEGALSIHRLREKGSRGERGREEGNRVREHAATCDRVRPRVHTSPLFSDSHGST